MICPSLSKAQGSSDQVAIGLYNQILTTRNPNSVIALLEDVDIDNVAADSLRAYLYYYRGSAYGQLAQFDTAMYYVEKGRRQIGLGQYPEIDIQILRALGNVNWARNFYNTALENYQEALEISERLNSGEFQVSLLGNIAGIYAQLDNLEKALAYALQSEEVSERTGIVRPRSHMKIGTYKLGLGQSQEAIESLNKTIELIALEGRDSIALGVCHSIMANAWLELKQLNEARIELTTAQDILDRVGYVDPETSIFWGKLEFYEGRHTGAKAYISEAIEIAKSNQNLSALLSAKELHAEVLEAQNRLKEVIAVQREIMLLKDSVKSQQVLDRVYELEVQYESAKQEADIARLEGEKLLATLEANESRRLTIIALAGAIVLILFLVIFYNLRLKKSKAEQQAREQQYDALQKRYIELLNGPQTFALEDDIASLNKKFVNPLTEREFEALTLGLQGKSNREIAEQLFVSESTIKFHLRNVYNKLGVANRKEALEYVVKSS